jgi:RNA polymerase sigma-70 factor (ECF subfamily)
VLTITRNLAIDALRMRRAVPTDPDDFVALGLLSTERAPEDGVGLLDAGPRLAAALGALPSDQRRAVVLAAIYGRTAAEISATEGIALGTAKTRIRAAMIKLRAALVDDAPRPDQATDQKEQDR